LEIDVDGVLVIDKPAGPTSHDVVAVVRRAIGVSRVGHVGTLDPLAAGVLPLVVGRATRLAQFLSASDKEYEADIRIGLVSETFDAEGPLTPFGLPAVSAAGFESGSGAEFAGSAAALEPVLAGFRGSYRQMPPPHSAKKVGGTPAYKLARRKQAADLKPVPVTVHALEVLAVAGDLLRVRIVCSPGFYVRRLAHDLGQRLGCGAYLAALRRTRVGSFTERDAVSLEAVAGGGFAVESRLVPLERLLPDLPAVVLTEEGAKRAGHGNAVGPAHLTIAPNAQHGQQGAASCGGKEAAPPLRVRLLDASGALLEIGDRRADGLLHPAIVLV
jgi:tRNA pseudouridine55 synthase